MKYIINVTTYEATQLLHKKLYEDMSKKYPLFNTCTDTVEVHVEEPVIFTNFYSNHKIAWNNKIALIKMVQAVSALPKDRMISSLAEAKNFIEDYLWKNYPVNP